jgi:hypothetical protein
VYVPPSSTLSLLTCMQAEIPGQDQDGYDAEPNSFHGMHQVRATTDPSFLSHTHHSLQHSQNSQPRPQQRHRPLKRLRLTLTRTPHSAPSPAPPTTSPPVTTTTSFKTNLGHIFTRPPHNATPPVVDVPFAKGKEVRSVDLNATAS